MPPSFSSTFPRLVLVALTSARVAFLPALVVTSTCSGSVLGSLSSFACVVPLASFERVASAEDHFEPVVIAVDLDDLEEDVETYVYVQRMEFAFVE